MKRTGPRPPATTIIPCRRRRQRHPTAALATAAALALCVGAALAAPAAAQSATARPHHTRAVLRDAARQDSPTGTGSGAAFCNSYGGLSTSGDSLDDVYPCANPNIKDPFGYQCVEYSARFESVVYGLGGVTGPGADVVDQLNANDNVPIASPGTGVLPVPGDVVSMWGAGQNSDGHTGVVSAVSVNASGTGTITYLDENGSLASNGDSVGYDTIYVNNWTWSVSWSAPYAYNQFDFTEQGSAPAALPTIVVRSGSTLLAKNGVTGSWVTEAGGLTSATKILAYDDMIGYIEDNSSGVPTLWAKQGLNGTWYDEYGPVNAAVFTDTGNIVVRSGSTLLAKNGVTGTWVTEAGGLTSATKILAVGDMIGYIEDNSSGVPTLWAKQGLNGTWYDEYGPVNAAIFAD